MKIFDKVQKLMENRNSMWCSLWCSHEENWTIMV